MLDHSLPWSLDDGSLRVQVEHGNVRLGAVLMVMHQSVCVDLKKIVVRRRRGSELVVDDSMPSEPMIEKDIVDSASNVRVNITSDVKCHIHAFATIAEQLLLYRAR